MRRLLTLTAIFILSLFLRFLYLGYVPVALSHDETDNIIQAHAVIQTGSDIAGTWRPWNFLPNSGVMAELGPLINVPALYALPQSIFASRFTTALLSAIFPLLVYWWLTLLKVKPSVATMAALLLVVSPWHLIFSRTALEQPTSLFFYLLSWIFLTLFFKPKQSQSRHILYSLLFILTYSIGFFTYHGYKFALPGMTILYAAYLFWQSRPRRKLPLLIALSVVGILLIRTALFASYYASRSGEIILLQNDRFTAEVNSERRQSVAPDKLKSIFVNKPLVMLSVIRDKYIGAISPDLLFLHGESNGVFSVWLSGYFYLFTLPFLLAGLYYLLARHRPEHLLLLGLLLVSPLASVIHVNNTFAFRSAIYFVLLNIVLAYGVVWALERYRFLKPIFAILLLSGLASFCYIFYFVTPVTNANDYFFGDRLLANYVRLNSDHKVLLVEPQPRYTYSTIVLAAGTPTRSVIDSFNHQYSPSDLDSYHVGNLTITRACPKDTALTFDTVIINKNLVSTIQNLCPAIITRLTTKLSERPHSLVSPKDSGEEQVIFGDTLCATSELGTYVHPTSLADFRLESMGRGEFCSKWVVAQ
jgi:hypothetical protein